MHYLTLIECRCNSNNMKRLLHCLEVQTWVRIEQIIIMLFLYSVRVSCLLLYDDFIRSASSYQSSDIIFYICLVKINIFSLLIFFSDLNISKSISEMLTAWSSTYRYMMSSVLSTIWIFFKTYKSYFIISSSLYIISDNIFAWTELLTSFFLSDSAVIRW